MIQSSYYRRLLKDIVGDRATNSTAIEAIQTLLRVLCYLPAGSNEAIRGLCKTLAGLLLASAQQILINWTYSKSRSDRYSGPTVTFSTPILASLNMAISTHNARIELAVADLANQTKPNYMGTAKKYGVARMTLRDRFLGQTLSI